MSGDCLFCHPDDPTRNTVIARNATCYARLDNFPAAPGHIEVIPLRHALSLFDLTDGEAADAWRLLAAAREWVEREHGRPDGWTVGVNDGPAAGQTIGHLHIHAVPRWWGDVPDPRGGIRRALPNGDPAAWLGAPSTYRRS